MKSVCYWSFLFLVSLDAWSQSIEVEYDKKRDFTIYKTFRFGESQITTPADQKQIKDEVLNRWIVQGITRELEMKGLTKSDSSADLVVSYVEGTLARTDNQALGPLALTPGTNPDRNFRFEYRQSTLIIDLNDRSGNLIWRINSTTNMTSAEAERTIDAVIERGFKKFAKTHKKKKK
jgi:hypothetical protein